MDPVISDDIFRHDLGPKRIARVGLPGTTSFPSIPRERAYDPSSIVQVTDIGDGFLPQGSIIPVTDMVIPSTMIQPITWPIRFEVDINLAMQEVKLLKNMATDYSAVFKCSYGGNPFWIGYGGDFMLLRHPRAIYDRTATISPMVSPVEKNPRIHVLLKGCEALSLYAPVDRISIGDLLYRLQGNEDVNSLQIITDWIQRFEVEALNTYDGALQLGSSYMTFIKPFEERMVLYAADLNDISQSEFEGNLISIYLRIKKQISSHGNISPVQGAVLFFTLPFPTKRFTIPPDDLIDRYYALMTDLALIATGTSLSNQEQARRYASILLCNNEVLREEAEKRLREQQAISSHVDEVLGKRHFEQPWVHGSVDFDPPSKKPKREIHQDQLIPNEMYDIIGEVTQLLPNQIFDAQLNALLDFELLQDDEKKEFYSAYEEGKEGEPEINKARDVLANIPKLNIDSLIPPDEFLSHESLLEVEQVLHSMKWALKRAGTVDNSLRELLVQDIKKLSSVIGSKGTELTKRINKASGERENLTMRYQQSTMEAGEFGSPFTGVDYDDYDLSEEKLAQLDHDALNHYLALGHRNVDQRTMWWSGDKEGVALNSTTSVYAAKARSRLRNVHSALSNLERFLEEDLNVGEIYNKFVQPLSGLSVVEMVLGKQYDFDKITRMGGKRGKEPDLVFIPNFTKHLKEELLAELKESEARGELREFYNDMAELFLNGSGKSDEWVEHFHKRLDRAGGGAEMGRELHKLLEDEASLYRIFAGGMYNRDTFDTFINNRARVILKQRILEARNQEKIRHGIDVDFTIGDITRAKEGWIPKVKKRYEEWMTTVSQRLSLAGNIQDVRAIALDALEWFIPNAMGMALKGLEFSIQNRGELSYLARSFLPYLEGLLGSLGPALASGDMMFNLSDASLQNLQSAVQEWGPVGERILASLSKAGSIGALARGQLQIKDLDLLFTDVVNYVQASKDMGVAYEWFGGNGDLGGINDAQNGGLFHHIMGLVGTAAEAQAEGRDVDKRGLLAELSTILQASGDAVEIGHNLRVGQERRELILNTPVYGRMQAKGEQISYDLGKTVITAVGTAAAGAGGSVLAAAGIPAGLAGTVGVGAYLAYDYAQGGLVRTQWENLAGRRSILIHFDDPSSSSTRVELIHSHLLGGVPMIEYRRKLNNYDLNENPEGLPIQRYVRYRGDMATAIFSNDHHFFAQIREGSHHFDIGYVMSPMKPVSFRNPYFAQIMGLKHLKRLPDSINPDSYLYTDYYDDESGLQPLVYMDVHQFLSDFEKYYGGFDDSFESDTSAAKSAGFGIMPGFASGFASASRNVRENAGLLASGMLRDIIGHSENTQAAKYSFEVLPPLSIATSERTDYAYQEFLHGLERLSEGDDRALRLQGVMNKPNYLRSDASDDDYHLGSQGSRFLTMYHKRGLPFDEFTVPDSLALPDILVEE